MSLLKGMKVTGSYFFRPSAIVTQKYPDNRKDLVMFERFKGEVVMPHNEKNEHRCTGCGICEINCPNGTIEVISKIIVTEDGKKKRIIDKHIYRLGMCTFCALCVKTCPSSRPCIFTGIRTFRIQQGCPRKNIKQTRFTINERS